MIRHIFSLIWTGRKHNAWLFAELSIVFVIAWYMVDLGFQLLHNRSIPMGYELDGVYVLEQVYMTKEEAAEERDRLLERVRHFPSVRATHMTSRFDVLPFSSSFNGGRYHADSTTGKDLHARYRAINDDDYFEVFDVRSIRTGERARFDLSDPSGVIVSEDFAEKLFGSVEVIGRRIYSGEGALRIVDVIPRQKGAIYELPYPALYLRYPEEVELLQQIVFSVSRDFDRETFEREVGPCKPLIEESDVLSHLYGVGKQVVLARALAIFFVSSIALGIVGSFWFRMRKRRSEIGLRMALGSSRLRLECLLVGEALLLLLMASLPALGVAALIVDNDLLMGIGLSGSRGSGDAMYLINQPWLRYVITAGSTLVIMALVVGLSAWIPARQGANLNPVDALRSE